MALLDSSKISIAFKKSVLKAHTDNTKEPYNEALASFSSTAAATVFGQALTAAPTTTPYWNDGVVEFVRLDLIPDPSSNGHAFLAKLPADYQTNSSNPKKGTGPFVNGQQLSLSAGALQVVPPLFGLDYEGKPYRGAALVAPGDVVDWYLDYANGVIFQENDPNTSPSNMTHLECFIYIGDMMLEAMEKIVADPLPEGELVGGPGIIPMDTVDEDHILWKVSARTASNAQYGMVEAYRISGTADYQIYGLRQVVEGNDIGEFSVDIVGGQLQLQFDAAEADTTVTYLRV